MDLVELREMFRRDVADTSDSPLWNDSDIDEWINEAEEEACIRAKLIHERSNTSICRVAINPLLNGETRYTLNPLIIEITHASMTDSAGVVSILDIVDWREADRVQFDRRTHTDAPRAIIHHDTWIDLDCIPDAAYTLDMEVYRLPLVSMTDDTDSPEISANHHRHLLHWAKHRAYGIPDTDLLDMNKANDYEGRFEQYFGPRPNAKLRKGQNANNPHRNKPCWTF